MNAIDGTEHYERVSEGPPPSLLVIVLDTNPHAWHSLSSTLQLSTAIANLLVFVNAHLAFNHANRVAIIASHCRRTYWLYPSAASETGPNLASRHGGKSAPSMSDVNKYRPFALIEEEVMRNLRHLLSITTPEDLSFMTTTMVAGAIALALSYINRITLSLSPASNSSTSGGTNSTALDTAASASSTQPQSSLNSRILIVSTSGDLAAQYIPIMNLIFAAQHSRIPIDILKLAGDTVLLQQASHTTSGIFMTPATIVPPVSAVSKSNPAPQTPISILPTLLFAYLPDAFARSHLVPATSTHIDFRAACFCHRRVVDLGFVCSICLSIFCEDALPLPGDGFCLTCGTKLKMGAGMMGLGQGLVLEDGPGGRRKKKRKKGEGSGVVVE